MRRKREPTPRPGPDTAQMRHSAASIASDARSHARKRKRFGCRRPIAPIRGSDTRSFRRRDGAGSLAIKLVVSRSANVQHDRTLPGSFVGEVRVEVVLVVVVWSTAPSAAGVPSYVRTCIRSARDASSNCAEALDQDRIAGGGS
jgi:hypothetical protein